MGGIVAQRAVDQLLDPSVVAEPEDSGFMARVYGS
jgi:hypothetical protein